jgi:hypothetical protein
VYWYEPQQLGRQFFVNFLADYLFGISFSAPPKSLAACLIIRSLLHIFSSCFLGASASMIEHIKRSQYLLRCSCAFCINIVIYPHLLQDCGHFACLSCIFEVCRNTEFDGYIHNAKCAICDTVILSPPQSFAGNKDFNALVEEEAALVGESEAARNILKRGVQEKKADFAALGREYGFATYSNKFPSHFAQNTSSDGCTFSELSNIPRIIKDSKFYSILTLFAEVNFAPHTQQSKIPGSKLSQVVSISLYFFHFRTHCFFSCVVLFSNLLLTFCQLIHFI